MPGLRTVDLVVLLAYLLAVVGLGCYFVRRSRTTAGFTKASGLLPGWAVGLSIFGTFLSSNTFLGYPGKAFGENWNVFVLSLVLPLAAWLAARYFIPFYRSSGEISAYEHLENRFGGWARSFAMCCYVLLQIARASVVLYGVSIAMTALTGWPQQWIILVAGIVITLYTLLGGIEAVIWTDVVQSIVLLVGAVAVLVLLLLDLPEGPGQVLTIANTNDKFSLGSFGPGLAESTFWVVLLFGLFENLKNFGIDQSYVQRYHAAKSDRQASASVWLAAGLYLPVSALFLFIGTSLFAYYQTHPDMQADLANYVQQQVPEDSPDDEPASDATKKHADHVFPHFMVRRLPTGVAGLIIAALFAAAMSSIDTSLNSSATVLLSDVYKRYLNPSAGERESMTVLYGATLLIGALGTGVAIYMIGSKSIVDSWWTLAGIFAPGMLGLFLLGMLSRRANAIGAACGVIVGVAVIAWMTFSPDNDHLPTWLQSPFNNYLIIVIGTVTIVAVGWSVSLFTSHTRNRP